ncbi:MAG TPA: hypothetical protein VFP72_00580 [Kineosporiaceae bacterium]|nr:hypothetical protein [Kineosporiaceae bacterium]
MSDTVLPADRARIAYGVALRETADRCYDLLAQAGDRTGSLRERADAVRRMRAETALAWQRWVLTELLEDTSYEEIAAVIPGMAAETLRAQFADVVALWSTPDPEASGVDTEHRIGTANDGDPHGTAATLEGWLARHRDATSAPATALITGHAR